VAGFVGVVSNSVEINEWVYQSHCVVQFRGQKIQTSVERMFRIWKERRLYDNAFLKELSLLIEPAAKPQVDTSVAEFKVGVVSCYDYTD